MSSGQAAVRFSKWDFASLLHRYCAYCAHDERECGEQFDVADLYHGADGMLACRRFAKGGGR